MQGETEIAWAAGIVDGEGYIAFYIERNRKRVRLRVDNTDRKILDKLSEIFGGLYYLNKRKNRPNSKPCYFWQLVDKKAINAIKILIPYLISKKEKACKALNF